MATSPKRGLLLATDIPFWRANNGAAIRVNSLFAMVHELPHWTPTTFYTGRTTREDRSSFRIAFPRAHLTSAGLVTLGFARIGRLLEGRGPSLRDHLKRDYSAALRKANPDAVIIEYARLGFLWDSSSAIRPYMILDTHDLMHRRATRLAREGSSAGVALTREEEASELNRYDALLAIQEEEAAEFRDMCRSPLVVTVPHPVDVHRLPSLKDGDLKIAFVGGTADHNELALRWFLAEVWPAARQRLPRSEILVAGAVCERIGDAPSGVRLMGRLDNMRRVYESAHVAINPIQAGSGLKIKNLEAMSYARPLVTTSVGSEGMRSGVDSAFLVADSPQEWVSCLTALDADRSVLVELGQSGADFVGEHFSQGQAYASLVELLERF